MKKVYLFLAEGFETIEALSVVDVLRRCKIEVTTIATGDRAEVCSSHGVTVEADAMFDGSLPDDGDAVVLPGGYPGYYNLSQSPEIGCAVGRYFEQGKLVAAICGAPSVLAFNHIGEGRRVTAHRSVRDKMEKYQYTGVPIEHDGNLLTAVGAGYSIDFALAIARTLTDEKSVETVLRKMELS